MKPTPLLCLALFAAFAASPGQAQSVQEFDLPPGPTSTPTADPQVQGPVDPESPAATRPRLAPEPAASPTQTALTSEAASPRTAEPTPAQSDNIRRPRSPAPTEPSSPATASPADSTVDAAEPSLTPEAPASAPIPSPIDSAQTEIEAEAALPPLPWAWIGGGLTLLSGLIGALVWWRRRGANQANPPQIEPPLVRQTEELPLTPPHAPPPAPLTPPTPVSLPVSDRLPQPAFGQPAAPPLRIEAVPTHLTRSLMAASFACRLSLVNRGEAALENVTVGLDLITAHSSLPTSEQLAHPARPLPEAGRIARIEPGESVEIAHEVRLPTSAIRTMRQGSAHLYVPLLRVRAQARDAEAVARTFIVGTLPDAGARKLQPFRLDEMPQTYRSIGLAALD